MRLLLLLAALPFGDLPRVVTDTSVVVFVKGDDVLPPRVLKDAKAIASSLFDRIDVPLTWERGKPAILPSPDRLLIQLEFAPAVVANIAAPLLSSRESLARSRPFDPNLPTVTVLYDNVRLYSRGARLFHYVLAYTMAHELTHVIQRRDFHSPTGIMKPRWTSADLERMADVSLEFTATDVEFLQEAFDRRHERP